jgi:hypothetical protein
LPAVGGAVAETGDIAITEILEDHLLAGADHPAVRSGDSRILDDHIILQGAPDPCLTFGKNQQSRLELLARKSQ